MTESSTRFGAVTRRAFLGGLSLAAIAATGACAASSTTGAAAPATTTPASTPSSSDPSTASSAGTSAESPSSTSTSSSTASSTSSSATSTDKEIPAGAKATVAWTYSANGGMARNPYMAVWIEDAHGAFVKTLALYHRANGDNWLNSLNSWYAASGGTDTTTSGTVPAGSYTATWDGTAAAGGRAVQGSYYVCVETAAEHGSESIVRQQVTFAASSTSITLTPAGSIAAASVAYTV